MIGRRIRCFWCEHAGEGHERNVFRRTDTGETFVLGQAPVGAMYYADWLLPFHKGPDGHVLIVVTPHGPWNVDGGYQYPARGQWTRTGTPPHVTATPSIGQGGQGPSGGPPWAYHAWLRDGVLEDCE